MTDQELQIKVAEATGWTEVGIAESYFVPPTLVGVPPNLGYYPLKKGQQPPGTPVKYVATVPNWPEDLSACMRDLWPWLAEQVRPWGGSVVLEIILAPPQSYGEGAIGYCCAAYTYPDDPMGDGISEKGGEAICHAVLAVKEKLDA